MTKKHFEAIARLIAETPDTPEVHILTLELAVLFSNFNSRFDRERFLEASGHGQ